MKTKEEIQDKILEYDLKIALLKKMQASTENVEGFNMLIKDMESRKARLLKTKL